MRASAQITVSLPAGELGALLERVPLVVELAPGSGHAVVGDWWGATLDALAIGAAGLGIDATLDELTTAVRAELRRRIEDDGPDAALPLVLRLWVAEQRGILRETLEASARVLNPLAGDPR